MSSRSGNNTLSTFLLGVLCAAVVALLWQLDEPRVVHADSASSGAIGHMISVTGSDNTGLGVLYVVNVRKEKVAVYQWDRNYLYLMAVRDLKTDFEIELFNNEGRKKVDPSDIRAVIARQAKEKEK